MNQIQQESLEHFPLLIQTTQNRLDHGKALLSQATGMVHCILALAREWIARSVAATMMRPLVSSNTNSILIPQKLLIELSLAG
jgi:hypothetical protein